MRILCLKVYENISDIAVFLCLLFIIIDTQLLMFEKRYMNKYLTLLSVYFMYLYNRLLLVLTRNV